MRILYKTLFFLLIPALCYCAQVTYYGAAGEVSGSMALLQDGEFMCIIDTGSHYEEHPDGGVQKTSLVTPAGEAEIPIDPKSVDAIILTHAHLDHTGRLPEFYRKGYRSTIYTTSPTKSILEVMLEMQVRFESNRDRSWEWSKSYKNKGRDYFKAHWHPDCRWRKKISAKNKKKFFGSLFKLKSRHQHNDISVSPCQVCAKMELKPLLSLFKIVKYKSKIVLGEGVSFHLLDAKHIPGSSSVYFQIDQKGKKSVSVLFSGDIGSDMSRFLSEPECAPKSDYIFVEGTYGSYSRRFNPDKEYERFIQEISNVVNNKGIVWIPSFALDRTQRILVEIESAMSQGFINRNTDIYLPSPTAKKITELYIKNPEWNDKDIAGSLKMIYLTTTKDYLDLESFSPKPGSIIISTSGMIDSAYSVGLMPRLLTRSDLLLAFVGYQSPFTYGGQLKGGASSILIDGSKIHREAKTTSFSCFSGHGDADDIDRWLVNNMQSKISLVHGEQKFLEKRMVDLINKGFESVGIVEKYRTYEIK